MKKLLILLMAILLCSCGVKKKEVNNDKLKIVTSFYPIYVLTANIIDGANGVELVNLTDAQVGCLHDYQVTTEDMKKLESADIFIINGAGMELFLDKIKVNYPNLKIVDTSEGIEVIEDEHSINPHIWLSIDNAIKQVDNITKKLVEVDNTNAQVYSANMNSFTGRLQELKATMQNELANVKSKNIITFHEAFPYFAKEMGLNIVSVIEEEGTSRSPKEISEIIETIKVNNVKALFSEPQYSDKSAKTIADETGAKIYKLDPIVTGNLNKDAYINTMKANLEVLKEALGE